MDELIDNLAAYAGIPAENLQDEETRDMLASFAKAVAMHCAGRVVRLARERGGDGYSEQHEFAQEVTKALLGHKDEKSAKLYADTRDNAPILVKLG